MRESEERGGVRVGRDLVYSGSRISWPAEVILDLLPSVKLYVPLRYGSQRGVGLLVKLRREATWLWGFFIWRMLQHSAAER